MCTSLAMKKGNFYFGRTMDIEYEFGERVVITPRNYPFMFRKAGELRAHYGIIGMATVAANYPLYAEAANEKGLCMAGLNFPNSAYYSPKEDDEKDNVSPFEFIPWILGQCQSVEEARTLLARMHMIAVPFSEKLPLAPLHWHIADADKSIVVECTKDGMKIFDNPVRVMTNNPPFDFQLTNLNHYLNLTAEYPADRFSRTESLKPFATGMGAFGLPGDTSSVSRFVRTAFYSCNSECEPTEESAVAQFFHILGSVEMINGSVKNAQGVNDITSYTSCINATEGIYYYTTYTNHQLTAVRMGEAELNGSDLKEYPLRRKQNVVWEN